MIASHSMSRKNFLPKAALSVATAATIYVGLPKIAGVEIGFADGHPMLYTLGGYEYPDVSEDVYKQRIARLKDTYAKTVAYWRERNIAAVAMAKLQILEGDETFTCQMLRDNDRVYKKSVANKFDVYVCLTDAANTIVVTKSAINAAGSAGLTPKPINPHASLDISIAHEISHLAQRSFDKATSNPELQADCLGGQALSMVAPETVGEIVETQTYVQGNPKYGYGTDAQRLEQFLRGAAGSTCS